MQAQLFSLSVNILPESSKNRIKELLFVFFFFFPLTLSDMYVTWPSLYTLSLVTVKGDGSPFCTLSDSGHPYNVSRREPFSTCDVSNISRQIPTVTIEIKRKRGSSADTNLHNTVGVGVVMNSASLSRAPDQDKLFTPVSTLITQRPREHQFISNHQSILTDGRLPPWRLTRLHLPLPSSTRFLVYALPASPKAYRSHSLSLEV